VKFPHTQDYYRNKGNRPVVPTRLRLVVALTASSVLLISAAQAYPQQQAPSNPVSGPAGPQAIPASEVAERAEDLKRLLHRVETQLAGSPTVQDFDQQLNRRGLEFRRSALETDGLLSQTPVLLELREQERYWSTEAGSSAGFQEQLIGRAAAMEKEVRALDGLQAVWEETRAQVKTHTELEPLAERIDAALTAIQATKSHTQSQLDQLIGLQTRVAEQQSLASEMLDEIEGALAKFRRQMFERSNSPLWEGPRHHPSERPREGRTAWAQTLAHSKEFLRRESPALAVLLLVFLAVLILAVILSSKARVWIEQQRISQASARILHRPVSLAFVLTLTPALPALLQSPVLVNASVILLLLIAAIRLVPLLAGPNFQPFLYTFLALFLLSPLRLAETTPFVERTMYALSNLIALSLYGWLIRRARVNGLAFQERGGRRLLLAIRVGLVLLAVCFLLNIIGYFALARSLEDVLLLATCLAIVLYCAVRVAAIFLSILLEAESARSIATIRARQKEILKWTTPILAVAACIFWFDITLDMLTLRVQALDIVAQALNSSINVGKVSFSLRDVLTFILVLVAGFAVSRVIRFFLIEDLLSRINMERGLPEVISTTIYYSLLVAVFFLALASAGVDFSRFNVLTGAFGLGIGFGLQTVVNNFVSGLILKYERRVNVGDAVELAGGGGAAVAGKVQKVGIRASIIATYDGAEVIVPNSALVTNQVTNWTLSSRTRRSGLSIGVAYGTPPQRVIELLVAAATAHPDVLAKPAPSASFQGFGDSALNFQLYFWTTIDASGRAKSDVAVAVSEALEHAGIEIPYPQRDLRLRSLEPAVRAALIPENEGRTVLESHSKRSPEKEMTPADKERSEK
jgi:potassium-dependent mechanosensitive channel